MRALAAAALLLAALLALPAAAQPRAPLAVDAAGGEAGWRARVTVAGLLDDPGLFEALRGGLPLRFELHAELWRKAEPFDRLEGVHRVTRALLRAPLGEGYLVDDGRVRRRHATLAAAEEALRAAFQPPLRPDAPGRHYYLVRLRVETLSSSDLEELGRWLRGEAAPAVAGDQPVGRALERGVRRLFVRMLRLPARRYEARTPLFRVR